MTGDRQHGGLPMIGYYVHHQGRGHLHRALAVAEHCSTPVTVLSSLERPDHWQAEWVELPRDDTPARSDDTTAHGRLHWVPVHHAGLRTRMSTVSAWIERRRPTLLVSDVSVEVTLLARLLGVPVVAVAMRGDRRDPAHELAYDIADALLAPWPAALPEPGWPDHWTKKTLWTGGFSRFDHRLHRHPHHPRTVLLMLGAGGHDITEAQIDAARDATPNWHWQVLGGPAGWTPDPWPVLTSAEVIVTHGGQNAIAECAAARRPTIVLPQDRPYHEQHATARALQHAGLAVVVPDGWPAPERWPGLLARAAAHDGRRWARYAPGDGAERAAHALERLASDRAPVPA
ncbi:glycosyltransferase [Kitasatospora sp. NPDC093550]|uniref:glycosyltransferase n=1 Tax=Kitasatospora sp. NPDC093550 TaxID=3364089 RepID=UPI00382A7B4E